MAPTGGGYRWLLRDRRGSGRTPELGVGAPAVDVGGLDVEGLFPESFSDEL